MSCDLWYSKVPDGSRIDDLPAVDRRQVLNHIHDCRGCRKAALASDSSLIFELLPGVETSAPEVERIRDSVRTLRRAKELERSVSLGQWSRRIAAIAALFLVALLLDPRRPEELTEESPFAGALGVGAGQLDLRRQPASTPISAGESDPSASNAEQEVEVGAEIEVESVESIDADLEEDQPAEEQPAEEQLSEKNHETLQ